MFKRAKTKLGDGWRICKIIGGGMYLYSHPKYETREAAVAALEGMNIQWEVRYDEPVAVGEK